jgi:hypothetical protein
MCFARAQIFNLNLNPNLILIPPIRRREVNGSLNSVAPSRPRVLRQTSKLYRLVYLPLVLSIMVGISAAAIPDENPLTLPTVGFHQLRILSTNLLELTLVTTKASPSAKPTEWDFVNGKGQANLPLQGEFVVTCGGNTIPVQAVGFKRRVIYAPLVKRDLRIGNYLYLQLNKAVGEGQTVEVKNPSGKLWSGSKQFAAKMDGLRFSPVIHVNQTGYLPNQSKKAMVGYFLGNLGEMMVPEASGFRLVEAKTGSEVFQGKLKLRKDEGFNAAPVPYQNVMEADFTGFTKPGEYRLVVPSVGASFPFFIDEGIAAAFARTYALGLYHQRCGGANTLPYTRFLHEACHVAPAEVGSTQFTNQVLFLSQVTENYKDNPRHFAPQLKDFNASLYPFVKKGKVDVSGGHHDAGDYSKYTINSAALVHTLIFAVDALPGVGDLDNLGLPESGDGKSDVLQLAKWEADFLAKMQDDDGGFYFLVYPQYRKYENDVLPDKGDLQVVWPKNTAVTAAAVAALAQASSSPRLKQQFPEASAQYLETARKGWAFLERAIAKHGRDGAYQKITHYGDDFMHDDELAWAACELFLATGEASFHTNLLKSFNPADEKTRRWGWWRMFESYGRAIRSYATADRAGKMKRSQLDRFFLSRCEGELVANADDQARWSRQSAYGTSFPTETKSFGGGGWYFSMDAGFELAAGFAVDHPSLNDPRPQYLGAILENLNYEAGCNPVNVCYVTGLGWKRQRDIVHQYAQNDRQTLPPSGIPLGNIQSGFMYIDPYKEELGAMSFPWDGAKQNPYPIYDRWGDSFNVQAEFVIVNQGRALAAAAFLMAQTSYTNQRWKAAVASIDIKASGAKSQSIAGLRAEGVDLSLARIVWEAKDHGPVFGDSFNFPPKEGAFWLEAEAQLPDGRRVFAVTNLSKFPNVLTSGKTHP